MPDVDFGYTQAMKISYELNPPKIVKGERFNLAQLNADMEAMAGRASQLSGLVSGIHLTDSVLGIPRVSSVTAAGYIKGRLDAGSLSCSVRVRDRNFTSLCQTVSDAIMTGVDSMLVLMGDDPADGPSDSGLRPSAAVKMLRKEGYSSNIKLDLSFPAKVHDRSAKSIQSKLEAKPHSFVTQSISSLSDLGEIVDLAKPYGIKVAAVVMVPAEKNRHSASIIGLDWSEYEKDPADFVRQTAKIADRVLLTSPNSFGSGLELLRQLK
ncbi:putative 5 10-methylenetetrahydrofolate reductase-like protein [Candidatus Nitrososphaera gargensis Ga9.2]|uniref:Putative 5 10-methylenetetrahydrofolate reductase-like protein n=1 Tax=Nitrososphaera gargensis (strain Ga9.2) TaxID=1237085 RepID=K0I853_NITGG|nr:5 10-methylenetetrahydrofolate reductase-like protein [Candidatus Nitrososphaera gargensis]AFU57451.1 putative 5 10-methylenetetrahydrofolate reductase-like protein [Candidatus Nitrososphaera gargensis Ga9.2]